MSEEEIKPGDQVILSRVVSRRVNMGPFRVRQIRGRLACVERLTKRGTVWLDYFHTQALRKLKPHETLKQALMTVVPPTQRCQICGYRPGTESHFITVPVPEAFYRICAEDRETIKREVRKRVEKIVAEVFAKAKEKATLTE